MILKKFWFKEDVGHFTRWLGIYFLSLVFGAMNIGRFGSLLRLIAFVPLVFWLIEYRKISFSKPIIFTFLYVMWLSVSSLWSIDQAGSLSRALSQVSFLLLLFAVSGCRFNDHEIGYLKGCLVWSSRITAVFTLIFAGYVNGRMYLSAGSMIREDPNYLCAYFAFAVVAALLGLISGEYKGKKAILPIIELLIYAYIVLATGSRGGLLAILMSVSVVILFSRIKTANRTSMLKRIAVIAVIGVAAYVAARMLESNVLDRFTIQEIQESGGTGRYDIWRDAMNAFVESRSLRKLFGYGTATAREITYLFPFERHNVMHNMFIENLLEIGLVGLVLYVLHIFSFFAEAIRRKDLFGVSVLTCMLTLSLSTSIYTFKPYWNIMLFVLCLTFRQAEEPVALPALSPREFFHQNKATVE